MSNLKEARNMVKRTEYYAKEMPRWAHLLALGLEDILNHLEAQQAETQSRARSRATETDASAPTVRLSRTTTDGAWDAATSAGHSIRPALSEELGTDFTALPTPLLPRLLGALTEAERTHVEQFFWLKDLLVQFASSLETPVLVADGATSTSVKQDSPPSAEATATPAQSPSESSDPIRGVLGWRKGDTVKYIGASQEQVGYGGWDDPRKCLTENVTYTIKSVDVFSWKTRIQLEEVPEMYFNSVHFEQAEATATAPATRSASGREALGKVGFDGYFMVDQRDPQPTTPEHGERWEVGQDAPDYFDRAWGIYVTGGCRVARDLTKTDAEYIVSLHNARIGAGEGE